MLNAEPAPDLTAPPSRMRSSSGSLTKGITGDTLTPTGMPAWASSPDGRSRRCGAAARVHDARQVAVERRDRHVDRRQALRGHRRDQVDVALDPPTW